MATISEVATNIQKTVEGWWAANAAPLLLAKLGALLPSEAQSYFRLERAPLKRFIVENLRSEVRLVSLPRYGDAAVPLAETANISDEDLYNAFDSRRIHSTPRKPRYDSLIWQAFRTPLAEGRRRFVRVCDGGSVQVEETVADAAPDGDDWIEIERQHLSHLDTQGFIPWDDLDGAIRRWSEGKVEFSSLLYHPPPRTHSRAPVSRAKDTFESVILGLRGFTPEELKRIQIPADVLLAFLERSSGDQ